MTLSPSSPEGDTRSTSPKLLFLRLIQAVFEVKYDFTLSRLLWRRVVGQRRLDAGEYHVRAVHPQRMYSLGAVLKVQPGDVVDVGMSISPFSSSCSIV